MYSVRSKRTRKTRRVINIHQNKFPKGYMSAVDNSRRPTDSFSDLTNMEIVQDNIPRPRPSLEPYGTQPTLTIIGRINYRHNGRRGILWMMNDSGTGKLYKQEDGGAFTLVGGNYSVAGEYALGIQSKGKVYVYNSVDKLSYIDLTTNSIQTYTSINTPVISSVTKTGMSGGSATGYYRVSANNAVGESIAATAVSIASIKPRDDWIAETDYCTVSWSAITGATSYTVYYGTTAANCKELYTVAGNATTSYIDKGTLATNPFKLAPDGNSTDGPVFTWMYVDTKNSQIFGVTADNKLYYSAAGTSDFSPYDGGGWVGINADGDTQLNFVDGFRNGKGDPVVTVSSRGAAGKGKLNHVSFEQLTVGDQILVFPNVYEANGQYGTYAPRATLKARDSITYFTGQDFRSTGTSQNIVNILTTSSISQAIENDIPNITLSALKGACGVEYRDKLYFALPIGSNENNEIWYQDLSRRGLWVLRWPVAAKDLWLYEDNDGYTHFCALVGNRILEFTRTGAQTHQDDGTPFRSRAAFSSLVWDEDGITLGSIRNMYVKLLNPKGTITVNANGLSRRGLSTAAGSDSFTVTTTPTFIGQWEYSTHSIGADPGQINTFGKSVAVLSVKPKGLLNQLDWEVVGDTPGTDFMLSSVNTRGTAITDLIMKA